jgi:hypothetical protein
VRETASKSALLKSGCLRWAHPKARWFEDRPEDAERREDGTAVHTAIHLYAQGLPYMVKPELQAKTKHACNYLDELKKRCQWVQTEVAMGINWKTGEVVGPFPAGNRDYPDDDIYFYGTADVLALLQGGSLLVADWKTGGAEGATEQLLSLGNMGLRLYKQVLGLRIATLYVKDDGVISTEREAASGEIGQHYEDMANNLKSSRATAKPRLPVVGSHCTELYCPHLAYCPQTEKDGIEAVSSAPEAVPMTSWQEDVYSNKEAGFKALRIAALDRALKYHKGKVKDWVAAGNKAEWDGYTYEDRGYGFRRYKL